MLFGADGAAVAGAVARGEAGTAVGAGLATGPPLGDTGLCGGFADDELGIGGTGEPISARFIGLSGGLAGAGAGGGRALGVIG